MLTDDQIICWKSGQEVAGNWPEKGFKPICRDCREGYRVGIVMGGV